MHHVARFPRAATPPKQPQHVGSPLRVGETVLLRRPREYFDLIVELRAIDNDIALVMIRDRSEIVELSWLRRVQHITR